MQIRGGKPPGSGRLARTGVELSREARVRLAWMDFYSRCGKVAHTCRHFGISRQTFYRWQRRYDPYDLTTLEERSHCPRRRRQPTWSFPLAEKVFAFAVAVSALGQRQAGGSSTAPEVGGFDVDGGPHSHSTQAARPTGGTTAHGSFRIAPRAAASSLMRCENPSSTRCLSPATWSKSILWTCVPFLAWSLNSSPPAMSFLVGT